MEPGCRAVHFRIPPVGRSKRGFAGEAARSWLGTIGLDAVRFGSRAAGQ